jgi:hypothetical protein
MDLEKFVDEILKDGELEHLSRGLMWNRFRQVHNSSHNKKRRPEPMLSSEEVNRILRPFEDILQ